MESRGGLRVLGPKGLTHGLCLYDGLPGGVALVRIPIGNWNIGVLDRDIEVKISEVTSHAYIWNRAIDQTRTPMRRLTPHLLATLPRLMFARHVNVVAPRYHIQPTNGPFSQIDDWQTYRRRTSDWFSHSRSSFDSVFISLGQRLAPIIGLNWPTS